MKRWGLVFLLLICFPFIQRSIAQNTSNKGKEFWVAYTGHVDGVGSRMYLYITSDVNTTVTVTVGGVPVVGSPFNISANQVTPVPIPATAYIGSSNVTENGKAIQVIAEKPVVVYSHIFRAARSAATLVLPIKVLGREYYASAYTQNVGMGNTFSEFTILAVEDNTTIEITPTGPDINGSHAANQTFSITLQKGQAYQYQSRVDVSNTHIVSVAGANGGCKPIAVFSGSTWVGFCNDVTPASVGGDNLYQQLYPVTAWGKEFITAPFINKPYDIFRVYISKDNTRLTINGALLPTLFRAGSFYEFTSTEANMISGSEPISVVQYQVSQSCDPRNAGTNSTNGRFPGDPEMTILNPVEQTLSKITVYSAQANQTNPVTQISEHYINVIIKDEFKASFTIDGLVPQAAFVPIGTTGYSYLQENVTIRSLGNPTHTLLADGGFSAIAYGYGQVESYGYLAGADVKNLFKNLQASDAATDQQTPDVCIGGTTVFKLVLPFEATSLTWIFDGVAEAPIANPTTVSSVINGVTVYNYDYGQDIRFTAIGQHSVKVIAVNPNPSGCDPNEEIVLDFEVFDLPVAVFSASTQKTCVNTAITFTDNSQPNGKVMKKWHWDFGDGSPVLTRSSGAPFDHVYTTAGDFEVKLWVESETGCASSVTIPLPVHITKLAEANFEYSAPYCEKNQITFTDKSVATEGPLQKWYWDFGDAANSTAGNPNTSTDQNPKHTFTTAGTYNVKLVVESDGCTSLEKTIPIVISTLPIIEFEMPDVCVDDVGATFSNQSKNADGSKSGLTYVWDFGDSGPIPLNTSTAENGVHKYNASGNYTVKLTVTTINGCSYTVSKTFRVNAAVPKADFEVQDENKLCSNKEILVRNTSSVTGFGDVVRLEWYLDNVMVVEDVHPVADKMYALTYPAFISPVTKTAILKLIAYSGSVTGPCQDVKQLQITLHAIPQVNFNAVAPMCLNAGKVQLLATETAGIVGTGEFIGLGVTNSGIFDPVAAGVGVKAIIYRFTSDVGCITEETRLIEVYPIPTIDAGEDIYVLDGGSKTMDARISTAGLRVKWTPATGLSNANILNPTVTPVNDTEYTLTVYSEHDCPVEDKVFVRVLKSVVFPNAFSPNGDGVNDTWILKYIDTYPNATVEIFNRYGEKVFFSQGYAVPFDGNYKNEPLPVGTYYYIISPKNGRKAMTGSLTLLR